MVEEIFQSLKFYLDSFLLALQTVGLFRIGVSKKRLKEVKLHRRSSRTKKTIHYEFS